MSGRRRSEILWDKEVKGRSAEFPSNVSSGRSQNWSKSEADLMHGNFSRSPSWDTLQRNRNGPKDDDIRRDRNRMYSHPTYDGREQHSTHPSDDSYDMPYRSRDKGIGGNARMSRERARERSRSPIRSRSRSRDGRSSRESTRGHRHETNASYPNMRNHSKGFVPRGGGSNITENWSHRTDYNDGSRYSNDYPHRTTYDDHRSTRIPCRYFAAGNCNRDNCRFSHDVPEASKGYDDNRNLGNKNRTWHNDQQPRDLNAQSNLGEMEKKRPWNSSLWDDEKSGGFDETSRRGHTLDENNTTWDSRDDNKKLLDGQASQDASSFHEVWKSYPNLDNKKHSWDGPTSWDDVKSGGFDETSRLDHTLDDNNTTWESRDDKKRLLDGHASRDESGFHDVGKSYPNLDNKKSSLDGPTWDGVSRSGFSSGSNPFRKYEESTKESLNDNAKGRMSTKSGSNIDRNKTKNWDGPLWDDVSEPVAVPSDNRKWGGTGLNNIVSEESVLNNIVPEEANQQVLTSKKELIQSSHDMNTQSHSYLNGREQSHMLLSNPFDGSLNSQVQGAYVHMENQNKGGIPLKPSEVDVSQLPAVNDMNETSLTSQLATQANAPLTETSHQEQLPQLYTDLHLTNAIDYLKSLPKTAYNQDTRAKDASVTQQNQMPADPTHDSSKAGQIGVMEKKIVEGYDQKVGKNSKKEEENTNVDNFEARGKVEEGDVVNDEKAMRQFKVGLVDFVKEILKPKWKEGKMSREVHKSVVKKVVEKIASTIHGTQIPKTQPKIEQYLAYSKPKITKLVEAYMERLLKA